jgi:hypothetical protein
MIRNYWAYTFDRQGRIFLLCTAAPSVLIAAIFFMFGKMVYVYSYAIAIASIVVLHLIASFFLWKRYRSRHINQPKYKF